MRTEPLYEHDCDACVFVGGSNLEGTEYDYYYCPRCDEGTVIARYSSDGPDYYSTSIGFDYKPHRVALQIAFILTREKGLIQ